MTRPRALPFEAEIRFILAAAMLLFVYTVVVGILNGLDLVEFSRRPLLAHLHVGTLGWITMAVFAASLALFGAGAEAVSWIRTTARGAPIAALAYNIAFLTTSNFVRPALGVLMMGVIVVFASWGFMQARGRLLSVPHLGVLAGLATSVVGAVLGVVLGIRLADPTIGITERVAGAHPATMVVGFLVPVGMALAEWVMRPVSVDERATLTGRLQIALPFAGGISILIGVLLNLLPFLMLSLPLEVGGLAIFLARMVPRMREVSLVGAAPARHGLVAILFLVVNIAVLAYLIANYAEAGIETAPRRLLLALDHSIFVGVLTSAILGMIAMVSRAVRDVWMDHVVFWGVTLGVTAFVAGLIADVTPLIRLGTPALGFAILFAVAVHARGMMRAA
jgi:hypothetical protein